MFQPKLGISLKVLTHNLTDEWVGAIAESRIETMEITPYLFGDDRLPTNRERLNALLSDTGIRAVSIHAKSANEYDFSQLDEAAYDAAIVGFDESIDAAADVGARIIVPHIGYEVITDDGRQQRMEQARRGCAQLEPVCRDAGTVMAVEILPRTCIPNTVDEAFELLDDLDENVFGVCLDVNHLMDSHASVPDAVRRLGSRLITLHLSDYDGVDEKHWMPGRGVIDWKEFMRALSDIDYQGPFNYECMPPGDTPEEMLKNLAENFDWLCGL